MGWTNDIASTPPILVRSPVPSLENEQILLLAQRVEQIIPSLTVVGLIDFGSRTKQEATVLSDLDIRAYVVSERFILHQHPAKLMVPIDRLSSLDIHAAATRGIEIRRVGWEITNRLRKEQLQKPQQLGSVRLTVGFCDTRLLIEHLAWGSLRGISEHSILYTGNVLYDPLGFLSHLRMTLEPAPFAFRLECARIHLDILTQDEKVDRLRRERAVHEEGQIVLWVKWALHYLRTLISDWAYIELGCYIFARSQVMEFLAPRITKADLEIVAQIYALKCNEPERVAFTRAIAAKDADAEKRLDSLHILWSRLMRKIRNQLTCYLTPPPPERPIWNTESMSPSSWPRSWR